MSKKYHVYGIGNPLVDLLSLVSDELLKKLKLEKGIMHLINRKRRKEILGKLMDIQIDLGGSCANTIVSLAGFGLDVVYDGCVGRDKYGEEFESKMIENGVNSAITRKSLPTGSSIILITEDSERTLNTYLGACQQYSREDVNLEKLSESKYLYFTGYMWDTENQKEALKYAIKKAKEFNTKVVFDVADPFAVNRSKIDFLDIINNHADFIFANEKEAKSLTETATIKEAITELRKLTTQGAVKLGKKGSIVFENGKIHNIDPFVVNAVDTTGAGDIYAAGFLYGLANGYHHRYSGKIASYVSAKVVEHVGARLKYSYKDEINSIVESKFAN